MKNVLVLLVDKIMTPYMLWIWQKLFGSSNDRTVKLLRKEITKINDLEPYYAAMSDASLLEASSKIKSSVQTGERTLDEVTYDAFALVREAAKRVLGQRHFDEQLMGGLVLHRGMITEMGTGEGKTLVATLPSYLNALSGLGVHVVTVNDYLAKRDAELMGQVHRFLGLSVGCVLSSTPDHERKKAYEADITYITNNELGFDYLRDNMKFRFEDRVQRKLNYSIVDEADQVLIDEARTPLIISGSAHDSSKVYKLVDSLVCKLNEEHFDKEEKTRAIHLNDAGISHIEEILEGKGLLKDGEKLYDAKHLKLVPYITQSLRAHFMFHNNVDYMIKDGQVVIIDEFTGRPLEGRRYSDGLHQAIEAKEKLEIKNENQTLASITFQNLFRMYNKLSGMTGTAMTEVTELKFIYGLEVVAVPPHQKVKRIDRDDLIYGTRLEKEKAIVNLIKEINAKGQPVLVGTVSIAGSERLSSLLSTAGIKHKVLNAKQHEKEAYIIAQAGRYGAVTIATNMAGRGTDIMLGGNAKMMLQDILAKKSVADVKALEEELAQQVRQEKEKVILAGGLYVIGTERHESRRIDNQLRGRSGRQGDPGETKFFLSLEDDLMRIFASDWVTKILKKFGLQDGESLHDPMITRALAKAQQRVEGSNYEMRKNLLKFDDVMNQQRGVIYAKRDEIIGAQNSLQAVLNIASDWIEEIMQRFLPKNYDDWNTESLKTEVSNVLNLKVSVEAEQDISLQDLKKGLLTSLEQVLITKSQNLNPEKFNATVKYLSLGLLDHGWKEHLRNLDHLRHGISLRAYGQKDPISEYKRESFELFEDMLISVRDNILQSVCHLNSQDSAADDEASQLLLEEGIDAGQASSAQTNDEMKWNSVPRNSLCPCNSGKKYKNCHGVVA